MKKADKIAEIREGIDQKREKLDELYKKLDSSFKLQELWPDIFDHPPVREIWHHTWKIGFRCNIKNAKESRWYSPEELLPEITPPDELLKKLDAVIAREQAASRFMKSDNMQANVISSINGRRIP